LGNKSEEHIRLQVFKRTDTGRRQEEYQLVGSFDHEPSKCHAFKRCFLICKSGSASGQATVDQL
jgi:hypothetical protein